MNELDRRAFMRLLGSAGVATLGFDAPRLCADDKPETARLPASADTVVLLWIAGGMASTETFDPKRHTPFAPGIEAKKVLSTFPAIPTAVDGIQFTQGMERLAKVMDRGALIRSFKAADLGYILHSRHQYHWHTGYVPPQTVQVPHLGAWIARILGPKNSDIPAFIDIGEGLRNQNESDVIKAFLSAGFLGTEHGPFLIPDATRPAERHAPPLATARFENREKLFKALVESSPAAELAGSFQTDSMLAAMDRAHRLIRSPAAQAFDLSRETPEVHAQYGKTRFGQGCLLARRLVEAGARFIEVHYEYLPFGHWDTHDNGHRRTRDLKTAIDGPVAQLVLDLEQRGLLDRTLIVLASEFSRDVLIEGKPDQPVKTQADAPQQIMNEKQYGLHAHFTGAGSVLLFGGGIKRGLVYGKTADEHPAVTIENPVTIPDLHATILRTLGIPPKYNLEIEGRPFYITEDGKGKPIPALLAAKP